jgi:hypothetical protein
MSRRIASLLTALMMLPLMASGQDGVAAPVPPLDIGEVVLNPGQGGYSAELAATGAQGRVAVLARIDAENRLVEPRIGTTSKSTQLDELAIAHVGKLRIKERPAGDSSQEASITVVFRRDTVQTVMKKSCGEFLVDLAFARGLDPDVATSKVGGYNLAAGIVMFAKDRSPADLKVMAKNVKSAPQKVEEACRASPDANFTTTISAVMFAK